MNSSEFKIVKNSQYKIMPWKNGLGSTAQIDIAPEGAKFPEGPFLWRVSSATVSASSPFSQFPGCDRWLVVLRGEGLLLNGKKLLPMQPLHFSGDELIHCDLITHEVLDLGVIYPRDQVQAVMTVHNFKTGEVLECGGTSEYFYIYCALGGFRWSDQDLEQGDTLSLMQVSQGALIAKSDASCVVIRLQVRT
ncbi:HutD family protein [Bdellovibrio sp. HCB2-146]|uniref:HutD/Ves family protein n=1 Tax=Bdellovibrio sp. HCB2-146 TaxID=3394362 RepID=UPI0039BCA61A